MSSNERHKTLAAVYLILEKDNKILLTKRFNTGWMDGWYSMISGHIEKGESVTKTMIREAKEEAGITISKRELKPGVVMHRKSSDREYMDFYFICNKWKGNPKIMEKDKCDDMKWFTKNRLPKNALSYFKLALKCYDQNIPFCEYGWK